MSSQKFTTALLAIAGVITISALSTSASAPPSPADTAPTTTIATPVVAGCATTVSGATSTTVDEAFINLCDAVLTVKTKATTKRSYSMVQLLSARLSQRAPQQTSTVPFLKIASVKSPSRLLPGIWPKFQTQTPHGLQLILLSRVAISHSPQRKAIPIQYLL